MTRYATAIAVMLLSGIVLGYFLNFVLKLHCKWKLQPSNSMLKSCTCQASGSLQIYAKIGLKGVNNLFK